MSLIKDRDQALWAKLFAASGKQDPSFVVTRDVLTAAASRDPEVIQDYAKLVGELVRHNAEYRRFAPWAVACVTVLVGLVCPPVELGAAALWAGISLGVGTMAYNNANKNPFNA
jgi:hypothetical protein